MTHRFGNIQGKCENFSEFRRDVLLRVPDMRKHVPPGLAIVSCFPQSFLSASTL